MAAATSRSAAVKVTSGETTSVTVQVGAVAAADGAGDRHPAAPSTPATPATPAPPGGVPPDCTPDGVTTPLGTGPGE